MKKLNPKAARAIGEKYFKKRKGKVEQDFVRAHSESVVEIATILAKKFKANASTVATAGWVHDIGRVIESKNHALHSIELLEKEGFQIDPVIRDCVLNHGSSGTPKTKEGKILQASDKLSILSIPVLKFFLSQKNISPEDIKFMEKMTTGAYRYFKEMKF